MKSIFLIVLSLLLTASAFAQPGTLNYPTTLDTPDALFRVADKAQSTLTSSINASATTITVASASSFPASGAVVIEGEVVYFTGKSSNNLTGLIRGASGTTAISHPSGASVRGAILAVHHNTQSQAIINIETKVGTGSSTPTNGTVLAGNGTGSSTWRPLAAGDIPSLDAAKTTTGTFNTARLGTGTADNTKFLRGDGTWSVPSGGGGSGTVTSVAMSFPSIFTVTGSPITSSGTITASLANQSQNLIFASPNASTGTPSFRSLVPDDIPSISVDKITSGTFDESFIPKLDAAKIDSGVFALSRLGTGTSDSSTYLRGDGTWAEVSGGGSSIGNPVTSGTNGSVLFVDSGNLAQDNTNLFWDNSAKNLRVGGTSAYVRIGSTTGYGAIWFNTASPALNNYNVLGDPTETYINASSLLHFRLSNSEYMTLNGTTFLVKANSAARVPMTIDGEASQTAHLQEWRVNNVLKLRVGADGLLRSGDTTYNEGYLNLNNGSGSAILEYNSAGLVKVSQNSIVLRAGNTETAVNSVGSIFSKGIATGQVPTLGVDADRYSTTFLDRTITPPGTTGAQTINKYNFSVRFAAAASSLIVTNSFVSTSTKFLCTVQTNDTTMFVVKAVAGSGIVTLHSNAAATAETEVYCEGKN